LEKEREAVGAKVKEGAPSAVARWQPTGSRDSYDKVRDEDKVTETRIR